MIARGQLSLIDRYPDHGVVHTVVIARYEAALRERRVLVS